ncbi:MAG: tyrosine recombinase [Clostridia bacterium]|nr:tyrosine recombinase [Clostridia bacterium]
MELIDTYIGYLEKKRGLSDNTLLSYKHDLCGYLRYLENNSLTIMKAKKATVASYLSLLQREGKSAHTIARSLASIRGMYKYLNVTERMKRNPANGIASPKAERQLPEILTVKEVDRLLSQPEGDDFKNVRDKAMLELLYATGIRASELIEIKVDDIEVEKEILRCEGADRRVLPFGVLAKTAIKKYLETSPFHNGVKEQSTYLFVNIYGKPLTRQGFWKIVRQYKKSAGIEKEISPKILRHSFATHLLENGADVKSLQELMGHSAISSTQFYENLKSSKLKEVYSKYHPRG